MKKLSLLSVLASSLLLVNGVIHAEEANEEAPVEDNESYYESGWEFNFVASKLSLKEDIYQYPSNLGLSLDAMDYAFNVDYKARNWISTVGISFQTLDDAVNYSAVLIDSNGKQSTGTSSSSSYTLNFATGPKWEFGEFDQHIIYAQLGYTNVISASNEIGNCTNCPSYDLDLEGGMYVKSSYMYNFPVLALGLQYSQYLSGDSFDKSFGAIISTPF